MDMIKASTVKILRFSLLTLDFVILFTLLFSLLVSTDVSCISGLKEQVEAEEKGGGES